MSSKPIICTQLYIRTCALDFRFFDLDIFIETEIEWIEPRTKSLILVSWTDLFTSLTSPRHSFKYNKRRRKADGIVGGWGQWNQRGTKNAVHTVSLDGEKEGGGATAPEMKKAFSSKFSVFLYVSSSVFLSTESELVSCCFEPSQPQ